MLSSSFPAAWSTIPWSIRARSWSMSGPEATSEAKPCSASG